VPKAAIASARRLALLSAAPEVRICQGVGGFGVVAWFGAVVSGGLSGFAVEDATDGALSDEDSWENKGTANKISPRKACTVSREKSPMYKEARLRAKRI
jgi:hypothetical protein